MAARPSPPRRRAGPSERERAQPIYAPRSPRPAQWRPARLSRLLLGAVPGVRTMALEDARRGLAPAAAGLALAFAFALIASGWSASAQALPRLRIVDSFELFEGGCLLLLAVAYEVLRLACDLEDRRRRPAAPRVVATPFVPAVLAALVLPGLIHHFPRPLEATWWASVALAVGSSLAVIWCLVEDRLHRRTARRRLVLGWGSLVGAAAAIVVFSPVLVPSWALAWSEAAASAGFRLLPALLQQ